jgi:hypothetical protein
MEKVKNTGVVSIHGREYETVALRVQKFRQNKPDWTLQTDIIERNEDCVVMRASISDHTGRLLATGHSEEYRHTSQINRTSALENAETSAIGRALAALGMGGTEFASANEVQNAIHQQDAATRLANANVTPAGGTREQLGPEALKRVESCASEVIDVFEGGYPPEQALSIIDAHDFGADEKAALTTFLDSKIRTALRKARDAQLKAKLVREEATQA